MSDAEVDFMSACLVVSPFFSNFIHSFLSRTLSKFTIYRHRQQSRCRSVGDTKDNRRESRSVECRIHTDKWHSNARRMDREIRLDINDRYVSRSATSRLGSTVLILFKNKSIIFKFTDTKRNSTLSEAGRPINSCRN